MYYVVFVGSLATHNRVEYNYCVFDEEFGQYLPLVVKGRLMIFTAAANMSRMPCC